MARHRYIFLITILVVFYHGCFSRPKKHSDEEAASGTRPKDDAESLPGYISGRFGKAFVSAYSNGKSLKVALGAHGSASNNIIVLGQPYDAEPVGASGFSLFRVQLDIDTERDEIGIIANGNILCKEMLQMKRHDQERMTVTFLMYAEKISFEALDWSLSKNDDSQLPSICVEKPSSLVVTSESSGTSIAWQMNASHHLLVNSEVSLPHCFSQYYKHAEGKEDYLASALRRDLVVCAVEYSRGHGFISLPAHYPESMENAAAEQDSDFGAFLITGFKSENVCTIKPPRCYGDNIYSQLGYGPSETNSTTSGEDTYVNKDNEIISMPDLTPDDGYEVINIAMVGAGITCFVIGEKIYSDDLRPTRVKCAGSDIGGGDVLGQGVTDPVRNVELKNFPAINLGNGLSAKAIAGTSNSACALFTSGAIKCWGDNTYGQLGVRDANRRGSNHNQMGDNLPFVDLGGTFKPTLIRGGGNHMCAVSTEGQVKCWGYNGSGQLGFGTGTSYGDKSGDMGDTMPIVDLGSGRTAIDVQLSIDFSCALLDNNTVKCWGAQSYVVGNGTERIIDFGPTSIAQIAAGPAHLCALLQSGDVKCLGKNENGILGYGSPDENYSLGKQDLPAIDFGNSPVIGLSATSTANFAVFANGDVKGWGEPLQRGRLGYDPSQMGESLPVIPIPIDL